MVMLVRLPAEPSRHRVAVWRELRRIGALSLGQGIWAVPDVPAFAEGIQRAVELVERGDGDVVLLDATGRSDSDADRLESLFGEARRAEWDEFVADCAKFEVEIDKELAANKLTLAELEEEEQSLERLRRWYRELKTRDVFGSQHATDAEQCLKACVERLEDYTEQVFAAVHQM
jgi:flagellar biosynthesis regulator FlaF